MLHIHEQIQLVQCAEQFWQEDISTFETKMSKSKSILLLQKFGVKGNRNIWRWLSLVKKMQLSLLKNDLCIFHSKALSSWCDSHTQGKNTKERKILSWGEGWRKIPVDRRTSRLDRLKQIHKMKKKYKTWSENKNVAYDPLRCVQWWVRSILCWVKK